MRGKVLIQAVRSTDIYSGRRPEARVRSGHTSGLSPLAFGLFLTVLLLWQTASRAQNGAAPAPLIHAHAHNDYEHERPLLDALDNGFCSVEADIYLVDGQLLVAHNRDKVTPERTLQSLYLDPLRQRVRHNHGRVYRGGPVFTLLIDVKSDAEPTYAALRDVLKQYADILTAFGPNRTQEKAVTAIVSGERAIETMAAEKKRYAGVDGRPEDLERRVNRHLIPLISDSWAEKFRWLGGGAMPAAEKQRLEEIMQKAHARGQRVRFWATPERPVFWQALRAAGVDLIGTDDLPKLQAFLLKEQKR